MATLIYTHNQSFHPDEILAIALLQSTALRHGKTTVIRTRDPKVLAEAQQDPKAFVIDVGFVYDPAMLNFDHHQKTMTRAWPDGTPYSACGLIWSWLRERGHLVSWGADDVLDAFEERLVIPADKHDNGVKAWDEGLFLMRYNRSNKGEEGGRVYFDRALAVAHDLLENVRLEVQRDIEAKRRMVRALAEPIHAERLVVIEDIRAHRFPYWASRLTDGEVQLVLTRRADSPSQWNLTSTPAVLEDEFTTAWPAPEDWRGRKDFTVSTPVGEVEIVFCHKCGHLTVVDGTIEQALAVAQLIQQAGHQACAVEETASIA